MYLFLLFILLIIISTCMPFFIKIIEYETFGTKETECTTDILSGKIVSGDPNWDLWVKHTNKKHKSSGIYGYNDLMCGSGTFTSPTDTTRIRWQDSGKPESKIKWQDSEFYSVENNCITKCNQTNDCGAVAYASKNNWRSYSDSNKNECYYKKIFISQAAIMLNDTIPSSTINCNKTTNDNSEWSNIHMCENGTYKT